MIPMDHKQLRMRGLSAVKANWALAIGAAVMAWLLAGIGSTFIPDFEFSWAKDLSQSYSHNYTEHSKVTFTISPATFFSLAHFIIGGTIQLGYCKFLLKQHDGQEYAVKDLFSQFDRFGQGFTQKFLRDLYTMLWGLLLVIPGIVKSLSYAMTPYIMAEQPELTAGEAIQKSMLMMDGHKWELFVLQLSFIGWGLLAALTLNLGNLVLNPDRNAAMTAFYRELNAKHPYL